MTDAIIIGGGPAGCAAALTLRMRNKTVMVLYGGPGALEKARRIDNYPGMPSVSGEEMLRVMHAQMAEAGVEMKKTVVQRVQPGKKKITVLAGSEIYTCRTLLVATGVPRKMGIAGEEALLGNGVSYCATCDGMFYKGREVAVIGSSPEAVEDANFLAGIAARVVYFPETAHDYASLEKGVQTDGRKVKAMEPAGEGRVLVKTDDGEAVFDGVFVLRPAVALSQLMPKLETENGKIVTDAAGRTNLPHIYAAGDVTGVPYQIAKAAGEGNTAALEMAREMEQADKGGSEE